MRSISLPHRGAAGKRVRERESGDRAFQKRKKRKDRARTVQVFPQAPEAIVRSKPSSSLIVAPTLVATLLFAAAASPGLVNWPRNVEYQSYSSSVAGVAKHFPCSDNRTRVGIVVVLYLVAVLLGHYTASNGLVCVDQGPALGFFKSHLGYPCWAALPLETDSWRQECGVALPQKAMWTYSHNYRHLPIWCCSQLWY